jgi:Lysophospholipase L1 and related esterases
MAVMLWVCLTINFTLILLIYVVIFTQKFSTSGILMIKSYRLDILIFLLLLPVSATFALSPFNEASNDTPLYKKNKQYAQQIGFYDIYKTKKAKIVMLGNSITYGCNWSELLGRTDIVGRGITSDNLEGYLARIGYVFRLKPKVCFVMGGVNDIFAGVSVDQIFDNYKKLIDTLISRKIKPVIQSTLFVNPKWKNTEGKNDLIAKLNEKLKGLPDSKKIIYMDLNSQID